MDEWRERIEIDPGVVRGKPVVAKTRLTVEFLVSLLAQGWSEQDILDNYPKLVREDIQACLAYAAEALQSEIAYPLKAG